MTYTVYDYESRDQFDRDKPCEGAFTCESLTAADGYAKRMQARHYWVRVYRDGEYLYHLTPKGEIDEP